MRVALTARPVILVARPKFATKRWRGQMQSAQKAAARGDAEVLTRA